MKCSLLQSGEDWDSSIAQLDGRTIYHESTWLNLVHDVFGHEVYKFLAHENDVAIAALPVVHIRSRLFADCLVSLPYVNYGGVIGMSDPGEQAILNAAKCLAQELKCDFVESRQTKELDSNWPAKSEKVSMLLPLPTSCEALFDGFSSKLRSQIRRPSRENPTVVVGAAELVDEFHDVFATTMRDLGTPVLPKRWFVEILSRFPESSKIVVVRLRDEPVAAAFLIQDEEKIEIPWAASLRSVRRMSMNMLLYWECLSFAVNQGCKSFDFGRSTVGSGTYKFKKQWGAVDHQHHWYYWLPEGRALPNLSPSNSRYQYAISVWRRLPVWMTKLFGPSLVKFIP